MSFLVGLLLLLGMREEECFWSFTALLKTKQLAGLYQGTLPLLHLRLYQLDRLIELRLPKLFSHFKEECMYCLLFCKRWFFFFWKKKNTHTIIVAFCIVVTPLLFASEWFSTLYCYGFALPTTLRIWDLVKKIKPVFLVLIIVIVLFFFCHITWLCSSYWLDRRSCWKLRWLCWCAVNKHCSPCNLTKWWRTLKKSAALSDAKS